MAGSYYAGQHIRVTGVLSRPLIEHAEGMFPYREYLSRHKVHFQLRTKSARDWRMLDEADPPSMPYSVRFQRWAREALAKSLGEEGRFGAPFIGDDVSLAHVIEWRG